MIGLGALLAAAPRRESLRPLPWRELDAAGWRALGLAEAGAFALLALWIEGRMVRAVIRFGGDLLPLTAPLEGQRLLSLQRVTPLAETFERAAAELWGVEVAGGRRGPFLDPHYAFSPHTPLAPRLHPLPRPPAEEEREKGDAVWEVGPAGDVLWGRPPYGAEGWRFVFRRGRVAAVRHFPAFLHRGVLALLIGRRPEEALSILGRIAPLSTYAHRLAFLQAVEAALETPPPPRAQAWRLVFAEWERVASLFTFLAILLDRAGAPRAARAAAQAIEAVRRGLAEAGAGRWLENVLVPGGVREEPDKAAIDGLIDLSRRLESVRFALAPPLSLHGLGRLLPQDFHRAGGFFAQARAAGLAEDGRLTPGYPPYEGRAFLPIVLKEGDAAARVLAACEEIGLALALVRATLADLPSGALHREARGSSGEGIGWSEGPAGLILYVVHLEAGRIASVFPSDPACRAAPLWSALFTGARAEDLPLLRASLLLEPGAIAL